MSVVNPAEDKSRETQPMGPASENRVDARAEGVLNLNIGCGNRILDGWVNCDFIQSEGVDRVFDASKTWPFPDNSADNILMSHVLEHILYWEDVVLEAHRVLKPGGILEVRVPYGFNAEAGHIRFFLPHTLAFCYENQDKTMSLEQSTKCAKKKFELVEWQVFRRLPLTWHLKHYLHINISNERKYKFIIGHKTEIMWRLRKLA